MDIIKSILKSLFSLFSKSKKQEEEIVCTDGTCNVKQSQTTSSKATSSKAEEPKLENWYFHTSAKNETSEALKKAVEDNKTNLMLLFIGTPGCSVCANVWGKVYTDKLDKFLASKKIVGLKIDDTASHYQALALAAQSYSNADRSKPKAGPPLLALIKAKNTSASSTTSISLKKNDGDVEEFIWGSVSTEIPSINDSFVIDLIERSLP